MYAVIAKTLKKYKGHFNVAIHVPVKTIIRDTSLMTSREKEYATNFWTHVDFLIYNTIDKSPLMAIEVDGSKYHKIGTKQHERDKIKNTIFDKYNLRLERFNTAESNEEQRLTKIIDSLLK